MNHAFKLQCISKNGNDFHTHSVSHIVSVFTGAKVGIRDIENKGSTMIARSDDVHQCHSVSRLPQ
jgi:uncharacterized membrane-anchored protein